MFPRLLRGLRSGAAARRSAPARALRQHPLDDLVNRPCDGRRQLLAGCKTLGLDAVEHNPAWKAAERARQLDRLADSEGMSRRGGEGCGNGLVARVDAMHRAGLGPGADGIDEKRLAGPVNGLDDRDGLTLELAHLDSVQHALTEALRHDQARGVIALPRVSNPEHERQRRSTSSWRKWVAQEMQGSWLRIACSQRSPSSASGRSA